MKKLLTLLALFISVANVAAFAGPVMNEPVDCFYEWNAARPECKN